MLSLDRKSFRACARVREDAFNFERVGSDLATKAESTNARCRFMAELRMPEL